MGKEGLISMEILIRSQILISMGKAGQLGLISTENQIHILTVHYRFTAFGLSQLETKFGGGTEWERKDNQGFISIGNFNRESSSQIFLLKEDITGSQYLAYLNGKLNLREAEFDRKIGTTRTHFNGKCQVYFYQWETIFEVRPKIYDRYWELMNWD